MSNNKHHPESIEADNNPPVFDPFTEHGEGMLSMGEKQLSESLKMKRKLELTPQIVQRYMVMELGRMATYFVASLALAILLYMNHFGGYGTYIIGGFVVTLVTLFTASIQLIGRTELGYEGKQASNQQQLLTLLLTFIGFAYYIGLIVVSVLVLFSTSGLFTKALALLSVLVGYVCIKKLKRIQELTIAINTNEYHKVQF